jgi:2-amino-4-hydroxy-6-hydroxymethyldihydropteridine diphosphokinase
VTIAYVALGANLGDRAATLARALEALDDDGVRVVARSPLFETDAVADEPQPPYLNAVARVETALGARALLDRCLAIEAALGRQRPWPRAPRTIDLDLLLHGDTVADEPGLVVPHPRLLERAFVRIPLALVAKPGLRHPITGEPLDRAAASPSVRLIARAD